MHQSGWVGSGEDPIALFEQHSPLVGAIRMAIVGLLL